MSALVHPDAVSAPGLKQRKPTLIRVIGRSIWRALETIGQRRAARELRAQAERCEAFDPALAQRLRDASRHDSRR